MSSANVVIVGAGIGGLNCARALAQPRYKDNINVTLIQGGPCEYHAGLIPVLLGQCPASDFRLTMPKGDFTFVSGVVNRIEEGRVYLADGTEFEADAIILSPGLTLLKSSIPGAHGIWSLSNAEKVCPFVLSLLDSVKGPRVAIAIEKLPIRCPPAPYGLAIRLANMGASVSVFSPESYPVGVAGREVGEFVLRRCHENYVNVILDAKIDFDKSNENVIYASGRQYDFDLILAVQAHVSPQFLRDFDLTSVNLEGPSAYSIPGFSSVWVIGDSLPAQLPKAAGVAEAQGRTVASLVLKHLGIENTFSYVYPTPSCFLSEQENVYSLIKLDFGKGPLGSRPVSVEIRGPSAQLSTSFEQAIENWRRLVIQE